MGKILRTIIGLSVISGTVVGLVAFLENLNSKGDNYSLGEFDKLVRNQKTIDEMNAKEILNWVESIKKSTNDKLMFIVAYPTKEIIRKYHLNGFPVDMDVQHNMLFLAVRENTYTPVKLQMVSFGSCQKDVEALFNGDDYFVMEE